MTSHELLPAVLPAEPLKLVAHWLGEALAAELSPNPNAMVLATADEEGRPHARVVLCKGLRVRPGYVTFFTNYLSGKGRDLEVNPRAAVVMHWDRLGRQVRLEGRVVRAAAAKSDVYFASRTWQSRLSAWASRQSEPVGSRAELERALHEAARRFGVPSPLADAADTATEAAHRTEGTGATGAAAPEPRASIPRPPHWGGYHLWIESVELWVAGDARLHDRARWQRTLVPAAGAGSSTAGAAAFDAGPWRATRLQP